MTVQGARHLLDSGWVILVTSLSLSGGCTEGDRPITQGPFSVRDSAGVRIVDNYGPALGPGDAWTVEAEPAISVGVADGAPEYELGLVSYAIMAGGRLLVADRQVRVVRAYGSDGAFEREFGREGEGPGEFQRLSGLWDAGDGRFGVFDHRALRVTFFTLDGGALETRSLVAPESELDVFPELLVGAFEDGTYAFAGLVLPEAGEETEVSRDSVVVRLFDASGAPVRELTAGPGLRRYRKPGDRFAQPHPLSPQFVAVVGSDMVYTGDWERPELRAVGPGGDVRLVFRWPAPKMDPATVRDELVSALSERDPDDDRIDEVDEVPLMDTAPIYSRLIVDDQGNIWVKRYRIATDASWLGQPTFTPGGEWWVFDPSGVLQGAVAMPDSLSPLSIADGLVVGLRRDDLGVNYVHAHRLVRPPTEPAS